MLNKNNLLVVVAIIVCFITAIWFSTKSLGNPSTYEVQPWISVPQYKTDAARAIDAYERLMERYINMTETSSIKIDRDLKEVIKKLDYLDEKLTKLSFRIARIEKILGTEKTKLSEKIKSQPKLPDSKAPKEYLPIW